MSETIYSTMVRARAADPETSREAAESVAEASLVQTRIRYLIRTSGPITDESMIRKYRAQFGFDATDQSLRSRRSELVKQRRVEFSGLYGLTVNGRRSREWQVVL